MAGSQALRVLDANVDRCQEGLRALEDVARFMLNDGSLAGRFRDLRHHIAHAVSPLDSAMLGARRADEDVGSEPGLPEEDRQGVEQLVRANAKRVEEALRVLEEFARLREMPAQLDLQSFKHARFAVYELEQRLVRSLGRQGKVDRVKGLYVVLDPTATKGRGELEVAEEALRGGASVIQFRDKVREKGLQLQVLTALRDLCHGFGALLIVNDYPELAIACGADGVHLGQKDLPLPVARSLLPAEQIVGVSCATVEEAVDADATGADYIAVGAMFPTVSKLGTRPAGLLTLRKVREVTTRPLVAIGGIDADNVAQVVAAGADAVAVISAVVGASDPAAAARTLQERMLLRRAVDSDPA